MTLRDKTGFPGNGFGIDPEDCGCTDCITGESFNIGDPRIPEAFTARRPLYNRSGEVVALPDGTILADGDSVTYQSRYVVRGDAEERSRHCPTCTC